MRVPSIFGSLLLALPALAAAGNTTQRPLILGLVEPVQDLAQLNKRLRHTARVPVQGLSELSPTQVSLTLYCKSAPQCDAAQARLLAATSWVRSVDVDAVRTRPTPASAAAAR
jgi:hypothetical protein